MGIRIEAFWYRYLLPGAPKNAEPGYEGFMKVHICYDLLPILTTKSMFPFLKLIKNIQAVDRCAVRMKYDVNRRLSSLQPFGIYI